MTRDAANRCLVVGAAAAGGYLLYLALRPRYDFRGKHVLITGGSRGLGLVLARQFADHGARLSICARTGEELRTAYAELSRRAAKVVAVECDVTDPVRVNEFVAVARQTLGPVDVLVNNAGVIGVGPLEEQTAEDFELSLRTHFWAAYHTTNAVVPEMKARRAGRIVNVSSVGGKVAVPHLLPYAVGKFALTGYSNGLQAELARHGVVVTTVCPGLMRTGSHVNAEFKGRNDQEYAWFALGNAVPGLSISAESAARRIIGACATGEAEVVLTLPARLAVAAQALFPELVADVSAFVDRWVLPAPGGIGPQRVKGHDSRGLLPSVFTANTDRAATRNNETRAAKMAGESAG
jgi:NAD(P)-dependent dehydrogenase (short-subunit alcohol dehydrogenase family)